MTKPYWTGPGYRGEYQCPHGVGHGNHVHGCCEERCCSRPDFPGNSPRNKARARNTDFVQAVNENTPCASCGGKPIEWHNPEHEGKPNSRVSSLRTQGSSIERIQKEMDSSVPLCRRCHMSLDGRMVALKNSQPYQKGQTYVSGAPCKICEAVTKPLRRGMCYYCYEIHRPGGRSFRHEFSDGCCSREDYPLRGVVDEQEKCVQSEQEESGGSGEPTEGTSSRHQDPDPEVGFSSVRQPGSRSEGNSGEGTGPPRIPREVTVIVDSREQRPLLFPAWINYHPDRTLESHQIKVNTKVKTLPAGDYTLEGHEDIVLIETKRSLRELHNNMCSTDCSRAVRALMNLSHSCLYPYVVWELTPAELFRPNKDVPDPHLVFDRWMHVIARLNLRLMYAGSCQSPGPRRKLGEQLVRLMLAHVLNPHRKLV